MGNSGHNSISHPHAQFPDNYDIEDLVVANFCYRKHNQSCPTCHTEGLLSYSCSFCIENTCERETCGMEWNWINNLEECRERIVLTETLAIDLDKLLTKYKALSKGDAEKFNSIVSLQLNTTKSDSLGDAKANEPTISFQKSASFFPTGWLKGKKDEAEKQADSLQLDRSDQAGKNPEIAVMTISCPKLKVQETIDEISEITTPLGNVIPVQPEPDRFQTRCYINCPEDFITFGRRCYSKCKITPKDELSLFCIEPEIRKPISLYSSCAEDCNDDNIKDFCFACPLGMYKKDCQCIKDEIIEFREIIDREHRPAIVLLH